MTLLSVRNLTVTLATNDGPARAVRELSFTLEKGETLGIVGESGCGKSMAALALMGLLPSMSQTTGRIDLDGQNLLEKTEAEMCRIRGNRMAMIFQEPMTSLNPVHTIGHQIMEPLRLHTGVSDDEAHREAIRLLELKVDLIHCNDWQTALIPILLDAEYRVAVGYETLATLLTIHNLAYQGRFWHWDMLLTGLDW